MLTPGMSHAPQDDVAILVSTPRSVSKRVGPAGTAAGRGRRPWHPLGQKDKAKQGGWYSQGVKQTVEFPFTTPADKKGHACALKLLRAGEVLTGDREGKGTRCPILLKLQVSPTSHAH